MFHIRGQAGMHGIRSAKPLKPGRYFRVVQVGMIAAAGADELKRVVMAALYQAVHDAGRLAPETRRGAVTRLAEKGRHLGIMAINAQPGITNVLLAGRCGNCIQGLRRPNACCGARVWNAHSTFLPGMVVTAAWVWSSTTGIKPTGRDPCFASSLCMAPRACRDPVSRCGKAGHRAAVDRVYSPVWSSTFASGAFFFTDSIPLSADCRRS